MSKIETFSLPKKKTAPRTNANKVPKAQWGKWSPSARQSFNWLYAMMRGSPDIFNHPDALKMKPAHWKTISWNAAWMAAEAVDGKT